MLSEFEKHGLRVQVVPWTGSSKTAALRSLRALIHTQRIELPDDPVLVAEIGRARTKPGRDEIETPRAGDSHCDLLLAVAASVLEHERHGPQRPIWVSKPSGRSRRRSVRHRGALPVSDPELNARLGIEVTPDPVANRLGITKSYTWDAIAAAERQMLGPSWGRRRRRPR
jgi:hypothetical protein